MDLLRYSTFESLIRIPFSDARIVHFRAIPYSAKRKNPGIFPRDSLFSN